MRLADRGENAADSMDSKIPQKQLEHFWLIILFDCALAIHMHHAAHTHWQLGGRVKAVAD
jgi:hypothetical protein